jgi:hypothetical protein
MENPVTEIERIRGIADPVTRAAEAARMLHDDLPRLTLDASTVRLGALQELKDAGLSLTEIAARVTAAGAQMDRTRVWQILQGK